MNEADLLKLTVDCMLLTLMLSMPAILAAAFFGVGVALFQAVTQVQEQVLGFAIKLVAVVVTLIVTARWMGAELLRFTHFVFAEFPRLVS
jgi:type III secretion protein S